MRYILAHLLLAAALASGCSRQSDSTAQNDTKPPAEPLAGTSKTSPAPGQLPFQPVVAESAETAEDIAIKAQARSLLDARNFQALDELATKLRQSKATYPDGIWKLDSLYDGLEPERQASDEEWLVHLRTVREWTKARPQSITPRVALGDALTSYAWKARGSGYADTVTDKGWTLLEDRLNQAIAALKDAKALKEKCPRFWVVTLVAAMGLGWDLPEYDEAFDEAVQFEPAYTRLFSQKATYLLPRWAGEEGDWEAFLTKAADARGGAEGDLLYARVIWRLHSRRYYANIFRECKLDWARCDRGFQVIIDRFPDSLGAKSERAYLATLGASPPVAKKALDALDGKVDLAVWRTKENFTKRALWAYSQAGQ